MMPFKVMLNNVRKGGNLAFDPHGVTYGVVANKGELAQG